MCLVYLLRLSISFSFIFFNYSTFETTFMDKMVQRCVRLHIQFFLIIKRFYIINKCLFSYTLSWKKNPKRLCWEYKNHRFINLCSNFQLTLKAPITTAADDNFCDIFPNLRKNKVWYFMRIVCQQTILMKYHALFVVFWKSSKIINCRLLQIIG